MSPDAVKVSEETEEEEEASMGDPETDPKDMSDDVDTVEADDSCEYSNDGECDEPEYCLIGTDTTDCNSGLGKEFDDKGHDREEIVPRERRTMAMLSQAEVNQEGQGSGEGSGAKDLVTAYNNYGTRVV